MAHFKTVIDSEWDVLQALHGLTQQINKQSKLEWVSSYQNDDLTIDITTLPIGTQLNIKAKILAS